MKEIEELLQIFGAAGHPDLAAALENISKITFYQKGEKLYGIGDTNQRCIYCWRALYGAILLVRCVRILQTVLCQTVLWRQIRRIFLWRATESHHLLLWKL